jgi:glycerophosphoryl diester phosphodiesterase
MRTTLITAHSGCMESAPNSREHIAAALAWGADLVELDIRLSRDGRVVLSHNDALELPGGRSLVIADHDWAELSLAPGPAGPGLLDLEEAFRLLRGSDRVLNLDAKEPEAAIAAAGLAGSRGFGDSLLFSGLGEAEARVVRARLPGFRCLLNADLILPATGYGQEEIREACRVVAETGCSGINLDWRSASPALLAYARLRCVPVLLWTIDAEEDLRKALALRPWSITTNRPDRAASLIAAANAQEGRA